MGGGIPSFPQSRFPGEKHPTIFRPSSPKLSPTAGPNMSPTKGEKYTDNDTASLASVKSFSSTVALLKTKAMPSFKKSTSPSSSVRIMSPEEREKMQAASASAASKSSGGKVGKKGEESRRSRSAEKRQDTVEAMAVHFTLK